MPESNTLQYGNFAGGFIISSIASSPLWFLLFRMTVINQNMNHHGKFYLE